MPYLELTLLHFFCSIVEFSLFGKPALVRDSFSFMPCCLVILHDIWGYSDYAVKWKGLLCRGLSGLGPGLPDHSFAVNVAVVAI